MLASLFLQRNFVGGVSWGLQSIPSPWGTLVPHSSEGHRRPPKVLSRKNRQKRQLERRLLQSIIRGTCLLLTKLIQIGWTAKQLCSEAISGYRLHPYLTGDANPQPLSFIKQSHRPLSIPLFWVYITLTTRLIECCKSSAPYIWTIYLHIFPVVCIFLNMRSGPYHVNIRTELVFHTTSEPGCPGPATTYLNVITESRMLKSLMSLMMMMMMMMMMTMTMTMTMMKQQQHPRLQQQHRFRPVDLTILQLHSANSVHHHPMKGHNGPWKSQIQTPSHPKPFGQFLKWGYPKMDDLGWKTLLRYIKMDDSGVPAFWETSMIFSVARCSSTCHHNLCRCFLGPWPRPPQAAMSEGEASFTSRDQQQF